MARLPSMAEALADPICWALRASGGTWRSARHLELVADHILRLYRLESQRLIVSMPPGHGKSEFISRWVPTWWLATRPQTRIILASYAQDVTFGWSQAARETLHEVGPAFGVVTNWRGSNKRWAVFDAQTRRRTGGSLRASGTEGVVTGQRAEVFIVDDPVKNQREAERPSRRREVWEFWDAVAQTRLLPHSVVIVVMTRWHDQDLAGQLVEHHARNPGGYPWDVVNLPAIALDDDPMGRAPGEPLWPEAFPLEHLLKVRADTSPRTWQCLYQGRPSAPEGQVFRRAHFRYCTVDERSRSVTVDGALRPLDGAVRFATVDVATTLKTHGDYTAIAVCAWLPATRELVVLEVVRKRVEVEELLADLLALVGRWALSAVFVEHVPHQQAVTQVLRAARLPIHDVQADRDKVARALPVQAAFTAGWLRLWEGQGWLGELERELLQFSPRSDHDDQVDALGYAVRVALQLRDLAGATAPAPHRAREGAGTWRIGR